MQPAGSVQRPRVAGFPGPDIDDEPDVWSGAAIDDDRIRALAVGAYYGRSWGAYCDGVAFLPEEDDSTSTRRETAIEGLHESWGVDNADDARDTIRRLLAGMHAPLFELVHPLAVAAATASGWTSSNSGACMPASSLRMVSRASSALSTPHDSCRPSIAVSRRVEVLSSSSGRNATPSQYAPQLRP